MKKLLLCVFMLTAGLRMACGQTFVEHIEKPSSSNASVKVQQSAEINDLVNGKIPLQITQPAKNSTEKAQQQDNKMSQTATKTSVTENTEEAEKPQKTTKTFSRGVVYRVQAYAGGNSRAAKQQAYAIQDKIRKNLPNVATTVHFQSPRWICTAGNCHSHEEANQLLQQIKAIGIPSAIVIRRSVHAQH